MSPTTGASDVRVSVSYLAEQSAPDQGRWFWSYHVRIENGGEAVRPIAVAHWQIVDGRGNVHEVRGEGVVGEMPLIAPGASYDYVSGCPLNTPAGVDERPLYVRRRGGRAGSPPTFRNSALLSPLGARRVTP